MNTIDHKYGSVKSVERSDLTTINRGAKRPNQQLTGFSQSRSEPLGLERARAGERSEVESAGEYVSGQLASTYFNMDLKELLQLQQGREEEEERELKLKLKLIIAVHERYTRARSLTQ